MPRAHDYREAATELRLLDAKLARDWTIVRVATDPDRIAAGPTGALIERRLDAVQTEVLRARVELARLARICDRRADTCAGYIADLLRHRRLVATAGAWSPPPPPPARWVEP